MYPGVPLSITSLSYETLSCGTRAMYPGVPHSITSLSDETLSCGPVLGEVLNQNHHRLSLPVLLDIKNITLKPHGLLLLTVTEQPQAVFLAWRGVVDKSLALYPGVPHSISGSTSLLDEMLSLGCFF